MWSSHHRWNLNPDFTETWQVSVCVCVHICEHVNLFLFQISNVHKCWVFPKKAVKVEYLSALIFDIEFTVQDSDCVLCSWLFKLVFYQFLVISNLPSPYYFNKCYRDTIKVLLNMQEVKNKNLRKYFSFMFLAALLKCLVIQTGIKFLNPKALKCYH